MKKGRLPRPGGPSTYRLNLHLNKEERAMLEYLCLDEGVDRAVLLRRLIRRDYAVRNEQERP